MMFALTRFKDFFVNLFPLYALAYFLGASSSSFAYQDSFAFSSFQLCLAMQFLLLYIRVALFLPFSMLWRRVERLLPLRF